MDTTTETAPAPAPVRVSQRQRIWEFIKGNPGCCSNDIAIGLGISTVSASAELTELYDRRALERRAVISAKGRKFYRYRVPAEMGHYALAPIPFTKSIAKTASDARLRAKKNVTKEPKVEAEATVKVEAEAPTPTPSLPTPPLPFVLVSPPPPAPPPPPPPAPTPIPTMTPKQLVASLSIMEALELYQELSNVFSKVSAKL